MEFTLPSSFPVLLFLYFILTCPDSYNLEENPSILLATCTNVLNIEHHSPDFLGPLLCALLSYVEDPGSAYVISPSFAASKTLEVLLQRIVKVMEDPRYVSILEDLVRLFSSIAAKRADLASEKFSVCSGFSICPFSFLPFSFFSGIYRR